jgi:hypothetical protein
MSTCLETLPWLLMSPSENRCTTIHPEWYFNSPIGEDDNSFRAKVVEILHEHYPNVSPERISGMLQHESEVRAEIETRL